MPLDYEKLMSYSIPETASEISKKDTMLYAVGVGLGADPMDERQLNFVYEKDLQTLPTMASVIANPHGWVKKANVGSSGKSVHAGITISLDRPLPVEGDFHCHSRVKEVVDKGPGKAALVTTEREVFDRADGKRVFTSQSTSMLRGDGGFGGSPDSENPVYEVPGGKPSAVVEIETLPQQALIYRLSGDYNPLHAEPEVAKRSGFPVPILHGLCTYGIAGHGLLKACCDYDPSRLKMISARFSKPVYPGDTLRIEIWEQSKAANFRVVVPGRNNDVVLNFGYAEFR